MRAGMQRWFVEAALESTSNNKNPLMRFQKHETIVVPNMTGGLYTTAQLIELLTKLDREPAGYALAGYSVNGETEFADGERMVNEFFVPARELEMLVRNRDKTVIVVDDTECSGRSYSGMREGLRKIGFKNIYKIATRDSMVLDGNGSCIFCYRGQHGT
ncbi:MAG: hypothetical protein JRM99_07035 [Nitrososphaerota archaeon]|nr:hypothetical protein [Nitrososphaerota archaeon]